MGRRNIGYQPKRSELDIQNPPKGGSGVPNGTIKWPKYDVVSEGYDPDQIRQEKKSMKENYGRILTTPERIVRDYRNNIAPMAPIIKKRASLLERIIKIFFLFTLGWGIGYFHHFFAVAR